MKETCAKSYMRYKYNNMCFSSVLFFNKKIINNIFCHVKKTIKFLLILKWSCPIIDITCDEHNNNEK